MKPNLHMRLALLGTAEKGSWSPKVFGLAMVPTAEWTDKAHMAHSKCLVDLPEMISFAVTPHSSTVIAIRTLVGENKVDVFEKVNKITGKYLLWGDDEMRAMTNVPWKALMETEE